MYTLNAHAMGELLTTELAYHISHYGNAMTDRFDLYHIEGDSSYFRVVLSINPSRSMFSSRTQPVMNEYTIPNKNNAELKGAIEDMQAWIVMVSWSRMGTSKKKQVA